MITVKAPGKLYIAGEYAVVETGFPAILVALNQFVTVTVEESSDFGSINSRQYQENSLYWKREGNNMVFDNRDNPFHY
ncbi:phosphomevalonate kinase, partial [Lacticaseibacillus paracasei]|nr:phosphomevalonate kinase [Lacticaseibacillus paracasei]